MARIRTIKPEFFTSSQVADCSPTARLLFVGLWVFSDDAGVHPADFRQIKMEVFPGDTCASEDVAGWCAELEKAGLLDRFESDGKQYLHITGWRHQKIEKPTYKHPAPPKQQDPRRQVGEKSSNGRRAIDNHSTPESTVPESIKDSGTVTKKKPDAGDRPGESFEALAGLTLEVLQDPERLDEFAVSHLRCSRQTVEARVPVVAISLEVLRDEPGDKLVAFSKRIREGPPPSSADMQAARQILTELERSHPGGNGKPRGRSRRDPAKP